MTTQLTVRAGFALLLLFGLAALNNYAKPARAGRPDLSFGNGGRVTANFTGYDAITDLAVQPDGKIVAARLVVVNGNNDFGVSRFNQDGSLDASFGNQGNVTTDFLRMSDEAYAVALQPDGKILLAGSVASPQGFFRSGTIRYNPDGTLDTSFGTGGKVIIESLTNQAYAMALAPDGKILMAGFSTEFNDPTRANFLVVRLNSNGTPDNTFDGDGLVTTDFSGNNDVAKDLAIQPDGKIIVVGTNNLDFVLGDFAVARYLSNGQLDAGFGSGGKVLTDFFSDYDYASRVRIQSSGKIVIGGRAKSPVNGVPALARYNSDGSLDNDFDSDGKATFEFAAAGIKDMAVQPNDKIVAVSSGSGNSFIAARLTAAGTLDTTFDFDGLAYTEFPDFTAANAIAIEPDGRLVVAGNTFRPDVNTTGNALARYSVSLADADFDGDNKTDFSVFRPANRTWYLQQSRSGFAAAEFGIPTDKPLSVDFDGDGKFDVAVFRAGIWYWIQSSDNRVLSAQFGLEGDLPVPADYDADGKDELAVYRAGTWHFLDSSTNQYRVIQFGLADDIPVPADFDRDAKTDIAVFRAGTWYLQNSLSGFEVIQFGLASDIPLTGDFDGDGKFDQAVYRSGVWYLNRSRDGFAAVPFGLATDIPLTGDFDGDDRADIAVFRAGTWYLLKSMSGFSVIQFGLAGDRPVSAVAHR